MSIEGYTEEELALLSDEERKALEGDEEETPEVPEAEETEETPEDPPDEEEEEEEGEEKEEKTPEPEAQPEEEKPEKAEKPEEKPAKEEVFQIAADLPEQFAKQLTELAQKFEEGDISTAEFMAANAKIQREALNFEYQQREQKKARVEWEKAQTEFFANEENARFKNPLLYDMLDREVRRIAAADGSLSGSEILAEAKNNLVDALGISTSKPEEKKETKPKAERPTIPNLGDLPAAAPSDQGGDEFAAIDRLSGADFEAAMEKLMTKDPAKYERYLARG